MNLNLNNNEILLEYLINNTNMPFVSLTDDLRIDRYNNAFKKLVDPLNNISNNLFENIVGKINISSEKIFDENHSIKEINCVYKSKSGFKNHLQGSLIESENKLFIIFKNFLIDESNIISEMSKMNIEMSNMTREVMKKNIQLKKANEKIIKLMNTDFLTGVANRKYFFERLDEMLSLKKRKKCLSIGIIFVDIDFFKNFNDLYGHDIGDLVLIKFSEMLKDNLRKEDIVARIGGEEFCIIVQCIEDNCLFDISEKLRKSCEDMVIENIDTKITASFGATLYKEGEDVDTLMKRADSNMYIAKKNGRNQVIVI